MSRNDHVRLQSCRQASPTTVHRQARASREARVTRPRPPVGSPARRPGKTAICRPSRALKAKVRVRTPMASRRVQVRARAASHLRAARGTRRILVLSPALRARVEASPRAPVRSQAPARTASLAASPREKMATRAARVRRVNAGRHRQATARIPAKGTGKNGEGCPGPGRQSGSGQRGWRERRRSLPGGQRRPAVPSGRPAGCPGESVRRCWWVAARWRPTHRRARPGESTR